MRSVAWAEIEPTVLRAADVLCAGGVPRPDGLDGTQTAIRAAAGAAVRSLRESERLPGGRPEETAALVRRLAELLELGEEMADARFGERVAGLASVRAGLERLASIRGAAGIVEAACREGCRSCGMERTMLSRVAGSQWLPEFVHWAGDPAGARTFIARARERRNPLRQGLVETTMVRERRPIIVRDAAHHPGIHRSLITAARSTSYVAAPIVAAGRVIGFLHADHGEGGATVDTLDRDLVHAFADGLGPIIDAVRLHERLRVRQREVAEHLHRLDDTFGRLTNGRVDLLATPGTEIDAVAGEAVTVRAARDLTARELEVLRLMATGAGNGAIAEALFIAPGTVKGHVRQILRKLGAVTRAEAVTWYLQRLLPEGRSTDGHSGGRQHAQGRMDDPSRRV